MLERPTDASQYMTLIYESRITQRQPLPIRGHHLFLIQNALGIYAPRITARQMTSAILCDDPEWAIEDTIGPEDAKAGGTKYTALLTSALEYFLHLPDDFPIQLVSGQRDCICALCAIGSHCNKVKQDKRQNIYEGDAVKYDDFFLQKFIKTAETLDIKLDVIKTRKSFDDIEDTREVVTIKIDKGTVKKILKIEDFSSEINNNY